MGKNNVASPIKLAARQMLFNACCPKCARKEPDVLKGRFAVRRLEGDGTRLVVPTRPLGELASCDQICLGRAHLVEWRRHVPAHRDESG
jgi:hypothetical protein